MTLAHQLAKMNVTVTESFDSLEALENIEANDQ